LDSSDQVRRVLIVTSTWGPAMTADMQRARMLAWDLPAAGWRVEVLSPDVSYQHPLTIDIDSKGFFPSDTKVHPVGPWWPAVFRRLNMRTIGWRSVWPMYWQGLRILRSTKIDIVYFSTTQFLLFCLGPLWERATGVRFVVDFHDPWYREKKVHVTNKHAFKSRISNALGKRLEEYAMKNASGCVAVSRSYIHTLRSRYAATNPRWCRTGCEAVLPFAVRIDDFEEVRPASESGLGRPESKLISLAYVGVGGPIMMKSFGVICAVLAALRKQSPELVQRVRIQLFGTMLGWHPGDRKHLEDVAAEWGVADLVNEQPGRVSYRRSLELLRASDGALVLGVDDIGYIPSKLFGYALSGKPLLACLHDRSPGAEWFSRNFELGHLLRFDAESKVDVAEEALVMLSYLREAGARKTFGRRAMLQAQLSASMANDHASLFEACLK
jgi:hypothetical protein